VERRLTWVAWSMMATFVLGWAVTIPLSVRNGTFQPQDWSLLVAFTAFMVVGAVIVAHRPGNALGWVFAAIGLLSATGALAQEYAAYAYITRPGSLPGAVLAAWYHQQWWFPMLALVLVFTLLLFPTGRLLSARWRPVAVAAAVATAGTAVLTALQPTVDLQDSHYPVRNPIGLAWVADPEASLVGTVLFALLFVCILAAVVSMVVRFRRARGVERQQLKWFTYAGVLLVLWMLVTDSLLQDVEVLASLFGLAVALVPVSAGIAILRYRLYDIDRIINRTVVYGLLTAVLGLGYYGSVALLGQVLGRRSSIVIAGATLLVAALFHPARRRIQHAVDRRFNRRRYDAARTVEAFSARLRDQIDLDTLSTELLAVVDQTMEPTRLSLWLRPSGIVAQSQRDVLARPLASHVSSTIPGR
jgi:hypothetical protein